MSLRPLRIAITCGNGVELGVTTVDDLIIQTQDTGFHVDRIHLGRMTRKRIEELQSYLERLKIHAVD